MVNSEELAGTTEYLTLHTKCGIQRCCYNRGFDSTHTHTHTNTHTHTHTHNVSYDIADLLMRTAWELSFLVIQGSIISTAKPEPHSPVTGAPAITFRWTKFEVLAPMSNIGYPDQIFS